MIHRELKKCDDTGKGYRSFKFTNIQRKLTIKIFCLFPITVIKKLYKEKNTEKEVRASLKKKLVLYLKKKSILSIQSKAMKRANVKVAGSYFKTHL